MTATPLAEAYEKLKELRRQGNPRSDDLRIVVDRIRSMLEAMQNKTEAHVELAPVSEGLIRTIEIRTLAERVFGDPAKAEAWLGRPSPNLSGQRPLDLLEDELGTAVVREMLERIDHGIFA